MLTQRRPQMQQVGEYKQKTEGVKADMAKLSHRVDSLKRRGGALMARKQQDDAEAAKKKQQEAEKERALLAKPSESLTSSQG